MLEETIHPAGENPLATAPIGGLLVKFAVPSVLSMLIDALYSMADQIFIGQGVGYLGIAATTVTFPLVTILLALSTLLGIGGSVYASMNMGAGKRDEAERTLGAVFTLAAGAGVLFTAVCLAWLRPLVFAFGATETSLPYVLDYAPVILLGAPFSATAVVLSSMARADGSPIFSMGCFLAGAGLNLILDPIYIFVLGWGVRGAAIATVTAQLLTAAILVVYFLKKGRMRLRRGHLRPAPRLCGQVALLGLPACMIQVAAAVLQIELNKALVRWGGQAVGSEAALSAVGIVLRISSVVVSVCVGIALGMQPILGFNKGAGLDGRVRETFRTSVWAASLFSVLGWLACQAFPAGILRLFGMDDPAYMAFGTRCMRIFLLGMLTAGVQVVSSQYYLATGQAWKAMLLSILRPLLLMVPLIHLFSRVWGLDGILYASPTADFLTAAVVGAFLWYDAKGRPRKGEA